MNIKMQISKLFELREAGESISLTLKLREEPPVGRRNIVDPQFQVQT